MKKVLILEDNTEIRNALSILIRENCCDVKTYLAKDIDEAYNAALKNHIDLFFIDIILQPAKSGDVSGYEFAKKIRTIDEYIMTPLIFITTVNEVMIHAFHKIHCYDYLEKPVDEGKLKEILYNTLIKTNSKIEEEREVDFRYKGTIYPIMLKDIAFVEVKLKKLYIYKKQGKLEIPYITLQRALEIIDCEKFIRCHRAIAINKDYIESINNTNYSITLIDGMGTVDIGYRYRQLFREGKPK